MSAAAARLPSDLGAMLQALLESKVCTREEVCDFVREFTRDTLEYSAK